MARRCGPAAVLFLALALGAAWGAAADDDDRCSAGWQPVEAGAVLDVARDVATRVSELANATGILTCTPEANDVVDCPRVSKGWLSEGWTSLWHRGGPPQSRPVPNPAVAPCTRLRLLVPPLPPAGVAGRHSPPPALQRDLVGASRAGGHAVLHSFWTCLGVFKAWPATATVHQPCPSPPSPCSAEAAREVIINLETDALGSADGTVQGIDVDIEVRRHVGQLTSLCCAPRPCCCAAPHCPVAVLRPTALLLCCAPLPCCCAAPHGPAAVLRPTPLPLLRAPTSRAAPLTRPHLLQRVTVDGVRIGDDLEDLFEDDDPREDTMVSFALQSQGPSQWLTPSCPALAMQPPCRMLCCHDQSPVFVSRRS